MLMAMMRNFVFFQFQIGFLLYLLTLISSVFLFAFLIVHYIEQVSNWGGEEILCTNSGKIRMIQGMYFIYYMIEEISGGNLGKKIMIKFE